MAAVLVVDDNAQTRALLASLLPHAGHRLIQASDGAEGFDLARQRPPDLVITDVLMPRMDGYEFLRRLRTDEATTTIPVIFYTAAYLRDEVAALADRWGRCWVLAKPSEPVEILRAVETALATQAPEASTPPPEDFYQEHLAVLNRKLLQQVRSLEESQLERQRLMRDLRETDRHRRLLLARLVSAQEEEAKRIAGGIHDDSIQVMAAVSMRLGLLARTITDPTTQKSLGELQSVVQVSVAKLRQLIFDLRPLALDEGGLGAALSERLERSAGAGGPAYEVHDGFASEPGPEVRVTLYRVAQEALANVQRHARASRVVVRLEERDGGFLLKVQDDGVGFGGPGSDSPIGHLGLTAMRERAEMAGGWTRVTSQPGAGTTVECWVPAQLRAPALTSE